MPHYRGPDGNGSGTADGGASVTAGDTGGEVDLCSAGSMVTLARVAGKGKLELAY
jgi:hypothetical protein